MVMLIMISISPAQLISVSPGPAWLGFVLKLAYSAVHSPHYHFITSRPADPSHNNREETKGFMSRRLPDKGY